MKNYQLQRNLNIIEGKDDLPTEIELSPVKMNPGTWSLSIQPRESCHLTSELYLGNRCAQNKASQILTAK